ncbi:MAG TPA: hypothetical protein VN420_01835 [Candidatus Fimivivens sp.]|nr:hypothetical protein [Candidatus Fimivivens sp.]
MTREKKIGPYIGRTGPWTPDLIREALALMPEGSAYRLMVGLLVGPESSQQESSNVCFERYTTREALREACISDHRLLTLIHYGAARTESLNIQLQELVAIAGPGLDGFQLNIAWPPIDHLEAFKWRHPEKHLVLQIGKETMRTVDGVSGLMERIGCYADLVDSVMFDPSGGTGKPFDPKEAGALLWQFTSRFPSLGHAVAGGLGPDPADLTEAVKLSSRYPGLSIDAESKVLTPEECLRYLSNAFALVSI